MCSGSVSIDHEVEAEREREKEGQVNGGRSRCTRRHFELECRENCLLIESL